MNKLLVSVVLIFTLCLLLPMSDTHSDSCECETCWAELERVEHLYEQSLGERQVIDMKEYISINTGQLAFGFKDLLRLTWRDLRYYHFLNIWKRHKQC